MRQLTSGECLLILLCVIWITSGLATIFSKTKGSMECAVFATIIIGLGYMLAYH